jgi:hypothetical protein
MAVIRPAVPVTAAWLCDLKEDAVRELPVKANGVRVGVPARGLVTVRMEIV